MGHIQTETGRNPCSHPRNEAGRRCENVAEGRNSTREVEAFYWTYSCLIGAGN